MAFLSSLALVLLSMVGYSSGVMIAGRNKKITPSLIDIIVLLGLWTIALLTRGWIDNKWLGIGLWILIGIGVGSLFVLLQRNSYPLEKTWEKTSTESRGFKAFWAGWKAYGRRLGNFQSRILLALIYFPIVIPFGILVRLFQDPFLKKTRRSESNWLPRQRSGTDLESIQRQF
jgi:hypothetical protein